MGASVALDLRGVSKELTAMADVLAAGQRERHDRLAAARVYWHDLERSWEDATNRIEDPAARITWLLATPDGPPGETHAPLPAPTQFTVIGVDGSQIEMERHALASFFLINTGWAALHYGTGEEADLASACKLSYKPEDLFVRLRDGRREPVRDELLAALRSQAEVRRLKELLLATPDDRPALGLLDGNLTAWPLTGLDPELQATLVDERMALCEELRERGRMFAGYISRSNGTEGVNMLRVQLCPDQPIRCDQCTSRRAVGIEACAPIDGVVDADVIGALLKPGERSQLFRSRSHILKRYLPEQHVYLFYLHVGVEIARVEVPSWIACDKERLDVVHALVLDQCERGRGFPPALVEAHEQAVVSATDRELFTVLLARKLGLAGIRANTSAKQLSKLRRAV